jgi:flagellin-like hook-associated protein FlgL
MSNSFFTPGTYSNTTTLGQSMRVRRDIASVKSQAMEAQTQLASGYKSATHGGLGADSTVAQELRHRLGRLDGYRASISTVEMRLDTAQSGLDTVRAGTEAMIESADPVHATGRCKDHTEWGLAIELGRTRAG